MNSYKKQLIASTTLPGIAGPPIKISSEDFLDGAICNNDPVELATELGFDAVLALRTRPLNHAKSILNLGSRISGAYFRSQISKIDKELLELVSDFTHRERKINNKLHHLSEHPNHDLPYAYAVAPPKNSRLVRNIEQDPRKILAAGIVGYLACKSVLGLESSGVFATQGQFEELAAIE